MNIDTWALVFATGMSPLIAVWVGGLLERRASAQQRKHWVFSVLMGLRGASLSPDHVRALNVVQVEFHDKPKVIEKWRLFLNHLETKVDPAEADTWNQKHRDLLSGLLVALAQCLKINADETEIRRGGYSPVGWATKEGREDTIQRGREEWAKFLLSDQFKGAMMAMAASNLPEKLDEAMTLIRGNTVSANTTEPRA